MNETNLPKLLMVLPLGGLSEPTHNRVLRYAAKPHGRTLRIIQKKGEKMKYPFETTKKGHPILDTEEKLQWYMNRLLHREVDLYYVNAEAHDLESVWLRKRRCENSQSIPINSFICAAPTFIEPDHYGRVDRSVVPVLRAIHARRDAEMEQRRKEAVIKSHKERQKLMVEKMHMEKETENVCKGWWNKILKREETHE